MKLDLHCHSNASDGELSAPELIRLAEKNAVDVLSITDHDTLAAYSKIDRNALPVLLIPGVEFSTTWRGIGIHVLGLRVDPTHPSMLHAVEAQQAARFERAMIIATRLEKLGFPGCLEAASDLAAGDQIGRPHFARHLVNCGVVKNISAAFKKYLGPGKPGDVKTTWASMEQIIKWTNEADGSAVLAHPLHYKLTRSKLLALLNEFRETGGKAMEVVSGNQTQKETGELAAMSRTSGLLASTGSDFHMHQKHGCELGCARDLPASCTPLWTSWF